MHCIPPPARGWRQGWALALAAVLLAGGCEEEEVRVYTTAKAEPRTMPMAEPSMAPPPMMAPPMTAPASNASDATVEWTVPEGWQRVPGEQPMREATFEAGEGEAVLEIAVSQFPGDVGGLLANVNRWRGQVGLEPTTEAELAEILTHFDTPGFHAHTMRLEGPTQHMLAAILHEQQADRTWFVKATGTPEVADAREAEVFAFVRSFRTGGDEAEVHE